MLPTFLVIGAQRSASTSLASTLTQHPDVFMPRFEQTYFEDPYWEHRSPAFLPDLFREARPDQARGFKRPELLARAECPGRIADELPDVRLVALLREPVARTVSAYYHYVAIGALPVLPVNEGLQRVLAGEFDADRPWAREVVEWSHYGAQLDRYLAHFDPDQLLVGSSEAFLRRPAETLRAVLAHLGVRGDVLPDRVPDAGNPTIHRPGQLRARRLINRLHYRYRLGRPFPDIHQGLGRKALVAGLAVVERAAFRAERPMPDLDPQLEACLRARFAPDVERVRALFGVDLEQEAAAGPAPPS